MTSFRWILALAALALAGGAATAGAPAAADPSDGFEYGRFGRVAVYRPEGRPRNVALFISGDGGWNAKVDAMARQLVDMGSMVVGVDVKAYLRSLNSLQQGCNYMAADFEDLSHEAQKRAALPEYHVPVLVGYSSGATLAYATLTQAPAGTFAATLSLGFCPDLPIHRPVCRSNALLAHELPQGKGIVFDPQPRLATPWVVLNGSSDRACPTPAAREFVQRTGNAELVEVPEVGHGFGVEARWGEQFRQTYARLAQGADAPKIAAAAVSDLPLVELAPKQGRSSTLVVMLTGDGGWAGIDQDLGAELSRNGLGVVGFNTLRYFWKERSPDEAAAALQRVIDHYVAEWRAQRVLLVGYSFGADALPFLYNRLGEVRQSRIGALGLLGLGAAAQFEIHVSDWLPGPGSSRGLPTAPEIARITHVPVLCIRGAGDESECPALRGANVTVREIGSGHHFGGEYEKIAQALLAMLPR